MTEDGMGSGERVMIVLRDSRGRVKRVEGSDRSPEAMAERFMAWVNKKLHRV